MKTSILVILFLLFAFILGKGLNLVSYEPSKLEINRTYSRSQYFGEGLGKVYKNRLGVFYFIRVYPLQSKLQTVFFSSLDPVLIFLPLYIFIFVRGYKKIR